MADLYIHDVKRVRLDKIEKFPPSQHRKAPFWSRELNIYDRSGNRLTVKLFADSEEELLLLDHAGDSLERMPDPPNCPVCNGTGNSYNASSDTSDCCHACNGEGVAQF